ncbi:MAG: transporter substrate-binding domain-containing protein [Desulfobacula sp.]|nr:transporter substrate-binding domain-containing protein [Desulfobacula sp.]
MPTLFRSITYSIIMLMWTATTFAKGPVIISGHPEYPPITWQQGGTITGAGARMTQYIFQELGVPYEIKYTGPWKRVQKYAEKGIIDVIISAYKNPYRLTYMDYTVSFMTDPVVVFVKKGNKFAYTQWEDLVGKIGNTNIGESYGSAFDRFIINRLTVERVPKTIQNFLKLEACRADYAIIGLYPGLASAHTSGYKDKIEVLSTPILEENFYMTFSKKSEYRHLIPKINVLIKQLRAESKIKIWIDEYLKFYKSTSSQSPAGKTQK